MEVQAPKVVDTGQLTVKLLDPLAAFYERLLALEIVEAMYANWQPDGLDVWLVVYRATETDREQIYAQEIALIQAFPGLGLDVHLIDRSEVNPTDAVDLTAVDAFLRFPRGSHHA